VCQFCHLPESSKLHCLTFPQFEETDYSVHVQLCWYSKPFVDTQLHSLLMCVILIVLIQLITMKLSVYTQHFNIVI